MPILFSGWVAMGRDGQTGQSALGSGCVLRAVQMVTRRKGREDVLQRTLKGIQRLNLTGNLYTNAEGKRDKPSLQNHSILGTLGPVGTTPTVLTFSQVSPSNLGAP